MWIDPPAFKCARTDQDIPCAGEMAAWPEPTHRRLANTVGVRWQTFPAYYTLAPGVSSSSPMAVRWSGEFQSPSTGEMTFALAATGPSAYAPTQR